MIPGNVIRIAWSNLKENSACNFYLRFIQRRFCCKRLCSYPCPGIGSRSVCIYSNCPCRHTLHYFFQHSTFFFMIDHIFMAQVRCMSPVYYDNCQNKVIAHEHMQRLAKLRFCGATAGRKVLQGTIQHKMDPNPQTYTFFIGGSDPDTYLSSRKKPSILCKNFRYMCSCVRDTLREAVFVIASMLIAFHFLHWDEIYEFGFYVWSFAIVMHAMTASEFSYWTIFYWIKYF